jgi:flagellar biosynthesis protein FlhA
MIRKIIGNNNDLFLVGGMIAILLVLFSPIPTSLLDFLIILNFSFGMTILMLTFYVNKPADFSTFPSLLLIATLFRLSLNIAATRLILTEGYAGEVIESVGNYAIQGNFIIGLVIFFILIVVQYVVVTAGAQRVSEVAARFTLDAVPGQQMSIDADLNMGLIDQDEARARRKSLEREASFYGAMDGASKFVKGDAIAGIIIVLINIVAGWVIGISQRGLEWSEALSQYTLLTIGDGIVTQVPGLIISVATGIIVTRSASDRQLSTEVIAQLVSVPRIPVIVMSALLVLLLLPGMPKWPIIILILLFAAAWTAARDKERLKQDGMDQSEDAATALQDSAKGPSAITIALGKELAEQWLPMKPVIAERISALRQQRGKTTGHVLPPVIVEDGRQVAGQDYEIVLFGTSYARGTIRPDLTLAIRSSNAGDGLEGIEARDPAFGLPALWIKDDARDNARNLGYTLVDPITALMTHLGEVVKAEAALLLSRNDVVGMLEGVRNRQAGLIEELIPNIMTVSDIQRILQNLLSEDVSILNIDLICDILVDVGRQTKDHDQLTELVRQRLSHIICNDLRGSNEQLSVLSLDPRIEAQISESIARNEGAGTLIIDPQLAETLLKKIVPLTESMVQQGISPTLLCGPIIRKHLRSFLRRSAPRLSVISVNEVPHSIDLRSFGIVNMEQ